MFDTKWYLLYDNALMQSNKICFRKIGPRWQIFSISTSTFWLFTFKLVYDICGHYKGNTLVHITLPGWASKIVFISFLLL